MFCDGATTSITAAIVCLEKEVSALFYSESSSSSAAHYTNTGACYSLWYSMTLLLLGFYSVVAICSNAIACYQFLAAWNLISRTSRMDLELLRFRNHTIRTRRIDIDRALDTQLYSELLLQTACGLGQPTTTCCPICLNEFEASDMVSSSTSTSTLMLTDQQQTTNNDCHHLFHQGCLRSWLQTKQSCPCCRYDILPPATPPTHPLLR
jgi:hypothetical protein